MTGQGDTIAPATIRARIQRHAVELIRLGWPVTLSRIGIIVMVNVNIWMVGRHSTEAVAYLGIGQSTLVGIMLVTCIGLLTGTTVYTARAFGEGNFEECGQVWRRSLPLALGFGILSALVCWPGRLSYCSAGSRTTLLDKVGRLCGFSPWAFPLLSVRCVHVLS